KKLWPGDSLPPCGRSRRMAPGKLPLMLGLKIRNQPRPLKTRCFLIPLYGRTKMNILMRRGTFRISSTNFQSWCLAETHSMLIVTTLTNLCVYFVRIKLPFQENQQFWLRVHLLKPPGSGSELEGKWRKATISDTNTERANSRMQRRRISGSGTKTAKASGKPCSILCCPILLKLKPQPLPDAVCLLHTFWPMFVS